MIEVTSLFAIVVDGRPGWRDIHHQVYAAPKRESRRNWWKKMMEQRGWVFVNG